MSNKGKNYTTIPKYELVKVRFIPPQQRTQKNKKYEHTNPGKLYITVKDRNGNKSTFEASEQVKRYFNKTVISKSLVDTLEKKARINAVQFGVAKKQLRIF